MILISMILAHEIFTGSGDTDKEIIWDTVKFWDKDTEILGTR